MVLRGERYQTVTTWGVIGLDVISLAMPKSAVIRGIKRTNTDLQYSSCVKQKI